MSVLVLLPGLGRHSVFIIRATNGCNFVVPVKQTCLLGTNEHQLFVFEEEAHEP